MKPFEVLGKIPYDIGRQLIAVFIAESLLKVLIENEKETALFNYVESVINVLENPEDIPNSLPLTFLLNLSSFLGFYPSKNNLNFPFFDLQNGCFAKDDFGHTYFIKDKLLSNIIKHTSEILKVPHMETIYWRTEQYNCRFSSDTIKKGLDRKAWDLQGKGGIFYASAPFCQWNIDSICDHVKRMCTKI